MFQLSGFHYRPYGSIKGCINNASHHVRVVCLHRGGERFVFEAFQGLECVGVKRLRAAESRLQFFLDLQSIQHSGRCTHDSGIKANRLPPKYPKSWPIYPSFRVWRPVFLFPKYPTQLLLCLCFSAFRPSFCLQSTRHNGPCTWTSKMPTIMAQYPTTESKGSIAPAKMDPRHYPYPAPPNYPLRHPN